MKQKLPVFIAVLFMLSTAPEVIAQTRGPNYNPGRASGSSSSASPSSSSSSSSSRGPSYNPPSRSSSSSSSSSSSFPSSSSSSRGSSYSPPSRSSSSSSSSTSSFPSSSSSSRGPSYNPPSSSSSSSSTSSFPSSSSSSRGPSYNPPSNSSSSSSTIITRPSTPPSPAPRGPSYDPTPPLSSIPSSPSVPRGPRYNPTPRSSGVVIRRYTVHTPIVVNRPGMIVYSQPRSYYTHVNRRFVYRRWIQEPVIFTYSNGHYDMDGYPYYVHQGYRYRYNPIETCNYELVDSENYQTVREYSEEACTVAYDTCAVERDTMNRTLNSERYFCAEAVDKDLEQQDMTIYQSTPVELSEPQKLLFEQYLAGKDHLAVFKGGSVGVCSIVKIGGFFSSGNKFGCKYIVKVSDKAFPLTDESICSEGTQAEDMNCNVGTEKENAGCIMTAAIKAGYCLSTI